MTMTVLADGKMLLEESETIYQLQASKLMTVDKQSFYNDIFKDNSKYSSKL